MMKTENRVVYDADIALVELTQNLNGVVQAYGQCFNDSKGRFNDGDFISTSYIISVFHDEGVMYIKTRNTTYRVVSLINEIGVVTKNFIE